MKGTLSTITAITLVGLGSYGLSYKVSYFSTTQIDAKILEKKFDSSIPNTIEGKVFNIKLRTSYGDLPAQVYLSGENELKKFYSIDIEDEIHIDNFPITCMGSKVPSDCQLYMSQIIRR